MDLAVKWRFFLSGGEEAYRWHIEARSGERMKAGLATDKWKLQLDDYVKSAKDLLESMSSHGFDEKYPVPIDPDGELLNGSHRVACALALEIPYITVELRPDYVWAPAWDYLWFCNARNNEHSPLSSGMLRTILDDWIKINGGKC